LLNKHSISVYNRYCKEYDLLIKNCDNGHRIPSACDVFLSLVEHSSIKYPPISIYHLALPATLDDQYVDVVVPAMVNFQYTKCNINIKWVPEIESVIRVPQLNLTVAEVYYKYGLVINRMQTVFKSCFMFKDIKSTDFYFGRYRCQPTRLQTSGDKGILYYMFRQKLSNEHRRFIESSISREFRRLFTKVEQDELKVYHDTGRDSGICGYYISTPTSWIVDFFVCFNITNPKKPKIPSEMPTSIQVPRFPNLCKCLFGTCVCTEYLSPIAVSQCSSLKHFLKVDLFDY